MKLEKIPKPNYESPNEHSEYSPSGSKRWINCPASIPLLRELPKREGGTNFYAEEGTAAHELAAYCLDNDMSAISQLGKAFNDFEVDREMAKEVQKYINYVNDSDTHESTIWIENRVSLEYLQKGMFGTADAIIITKEEIEIVDLKYGRGVIVEAEDNSQLMTYALGVIQHLKTNGIELEDGLDVKLTIVQPRAPNSDPIKSAYTTVALLKEFESTVSIAIDLTKEDEPPFGPTEDGCRWCDVSPICKAHQQFNLDIAKIEFEDFKLSPAEFKKRLVDVNTLKNDELYYILKHTKAIENWLKQVTEYAAQELKQGHSIKGYKLVYGRSNRSWEDIDKVMKELKKIGIEEDTMFTKKFFTPAQAEKVLNDGELEKVKDLIFKPTGKVTIAPEKDGRMAVDKNQEAKDDFKEDF